MQVWNEGCRERVPTTEYLCSLAVPSSPMDMGVPIADWKANASEGHRLPGAQYLRHGTHVDCNLAHGANATPTARAPPSPLL